jgi:hypothetical protein
MADGFEGVPVAVAAQRLGIKGAQVRWLVKKGILLAIPINVSAGRWRRYHIDEDSLKNYMKKQHRAEK